MALQAMWSSICLTNPETDKDEYVKRGELLPDWVDDFTKFALTHTGAVRFVEDAEENGPAEPAAPVRLQEHPPTPVSGALERPSQGDPKEAWVAYASDERNPERVSRTEANSMSKSTLMEKFHG